MSGYNIETGECEESFRERLIRDVQARDLEISLLRKDVAAPSFFFGTYSNGTHVFKIYQNRTTVSILSNRPTPYTPASGLIVGDKLHFSGFCGTLKDGQITWNDGSTWCLPKKISSGPVCHYVTIKKDATEGNMGLDIEAPAGNSAGLKITSIKDGLVAKYNASKPERPIQPGDLIIDVNGKNISSQAIREEVKNAETLRMLIAPQCPTETSSHSIDISCTEGGDKSGENLKVNTVLDGAAFSIEGTWASTKQGQRRFSIVRRNDKLWYESGEGNNKEKGELRGYEDGSLRGAVGGGIIRLRPQNRSLVSQFAKNGEEEGDEEQTADVEITLELSFKTTTNEIKKLEFTKLPLGFHLNNENKIRHLLTAFGAHAKGAEVGWQLYNVAGKDLQGMDRNSVMALLDAATAGMPTFSPMGMNCEDIKAIVDQVVHKDAEEKGLLGELINLNEWV